MGGKGSGGIDAALVTLGGKKIDKDGNESKSGFFEFLNLPFGDYSDITLTPEEAVKLRNYAVRLKYGTSAALPLTCVGKNCPYKDCIFHEEGNWPVGRPCPLESKMIQAKMKSYVEDLDVDPESVTEMCLVNELVELEIIDMRANAGLSADGDAQDLLQRIEKTNGEFASFELAVHPLLDVKARNRKERLQILESLAATRREKYKKAAALRQGETQDAARFYSKLKELQGKISKHGLSDLSKIIKEAEGVDESQETDWESIE